MASKVGVVLENLLGELRSHPVDSDAVSRNTASEKPAEQKDVNELVFTEESVLGAWGKLPHIWSYICVGC